MQSRLRLLATQRSAIAMRRYRFRSLVGALFAAMLVGGLAGPALFASPALAAGPPVDSHTEAPAIGHADSTPAAIECSIPVSQTNGLGTGYVVTVLDWVNGEPLVQVDVTWQGSVCVDPWPILPA